MAKQGEIDFGADKGENATVAANRARKPKSRRRDATIVAALITARATLVAAMMMTLATVIAALIMSDSNESKSVPETPVQTSISAGRNSSNTTPPPRPRYSTTERNVAVEVDAIWPKNGPPRIAGKLYLHGDFEQDLCRIHVTFQVIKSEARTLDGDKIGCEDTETWPTFEWSVPPEYAAETDQLIILVQNDRDRTILPVSCLRTSQCEPSRT